MKQIDEKALIIALTMREMDCRDLRRVFKAEWLKNKELLPIMKAIFKFLDEQNMVPSLDTVALYMSNEDKELFDIRHKALIAELKAMPLDHKLQAYNITLAKDKAIALSLESMIHTADFQKDLAEGEGLPLLSLMSKWLTDHTRMAGTGPVDIKTGIEELIKSTPWTGKSSRVPCGIRPVDEWSGGLRPGELGIVIAPTGGGKSTTLLNIAYNVAMTGDKKVLFLTNELTKEDQIERFMARMQGPDPGTPLATLSAIQDDPVEGFTGLDRKWYHKLQERLYIDAIDLNTTADELESMMVHMELQEGFRPDMIVIDYMEKMEPIRQVKLDKEWIYLQEIAKELIRLGVRRRASVWTAVQTNRQGLNRKQGMGMDIVQGSVRHLQSATVVVSCQKKYIEDPLGKTETMHFVEHKMRANKMEDREMYVRTDLKVMYISNDEVVPPDDIDLIQTADERAEQQEEKRQEQKAKRGGRGIISDRRAREGT